MVSTPNGAQAHTSTVSTTTTVIRADSGSDIPTSTAQRGRMGATVNGSAHAPPNAVPLSARKAEPLDMSSVERRGQALAPRETAKKIRPHGLQEAPTFRPTEEEFRDPMEYIRKIAPEGTKYGIAKIIPPDGWNPDFAIDTERFHFRTRRQELNSVEGGTRANLNYLDQLAKFHKQHGNNLNRFPSVDKRPLDLYKLKKAVETRGGFEKVCKLKKWAEIGRDLGYSGKIMSSLSTSLKNSYQKWLHPYEEYLRIAKPGVHQQLEFEYGGPFTPSPAPSPLKKSNQATPSGFMDGSPAVHATNALQASINGAEQNVAPVTAAAPPPQQPVLSGGFTAVNAGGGGFVAVNHVTPNTSFSSVNGANGPSPVSNGATAQRPTDLPNGPPHGASEFQIAIHSHAPLPNGYSNGLKRQLSDSAEPPVNGEAENAGRRSKRLRKDTNAPTVSGSHMMQPRPSSMAKSTPVRDRTKEKPGDVCEQCGKADDPTSILLCESCEMGYHKYCLEPPLKTIPDFEWHCPRCLVGTGEFGFEEGGVYSLKQFQQKAYKFKEDYFLPKMPFDPVLNCKRPVTEDDVEREFWRLVESLTETVEVEYGADIHSTTHGSGFPTIEKNPRDPFSTDPWNLNNLPLNPESLFRHIKSDISGMTVPWLYVGMCFSTFCWHNEDHYTYSANYQHFGATKTWYGIPAADAEKFEKAMQEAVPDLFETQPDLLFQLVTLLPPEQLKKAGVNVYALDQRAGQFVITFPQAYHAGFNHGFNFNEAVNFAPNDWEPYGETSIERLQTFRRQPCFSHDELLLTAAARDTTIKTAKWLGPAMERLMEKELGLRQYFVNKHIALREHEECKIKSESEEGQGCSYSFEIDDSDATGEEEYVCDYCKAYCFLSRMKCRKSDKVVCLAHAGVYECCEGVEAYRWTGDHTDHQIIYRMTSDTLRAMVQKVVDKARTPEAWQEKLEKLLEDEPKPQLKALRSLLSEGEKIPYDLPQLPDLRRFVERCNEWIEEAASYTTRKQQNRRKSEKVWRKGSTKNTETEEKEREVRKVENIKNLLDKADEISFDCAEIQTLRERYESIRDFQRDAADALANVRLRSTQEMEDLVNLGRGFNVDIPEVEKLDKVVQQLNWSDKAKSKRGEQQTLQEVKDLVQQGLDLGIQEVNELLVFYKQQLSEGELWEAKAKELMSVENIHFQQLDSLARRAATLPVSPETREAMEQILRRQREAQDLIVRLFNKSKSADFRQRPRYKEVRDLMEQLLQMNTKPPGTIDLEKEQKRHEDWMRRGKKLFGKANAPLHILLSHMQFVQARNEAAFDINDEPRGPVEPNSREPSPAGEDPDENAEKEVFCICRKPEAGMMIECEVCHEWYHAKCLRIARGRIKEDEKYTCPICDWRVRIPRDAARPELSELEAWQRELEDLPFQPEEEAVLTKMIGDARRFRDHIEPYCNPVAQTTDNISTIRHYLRKVEGGDVLLAHATNAFRKMLHQWAPVAPTSPPPVNVSLSTRKPRPTKQQKLMAQLGVHNVEELPPHLRTTKVHGIKHRFDYDGAPRNSDSPRGGADSPSGEPSGSVDGGGRAGSADTPTNQLTRSGSGSTTLGPAFTYDSPKMADRYGGEPPMFGSPNPFTEQAVSSAAIAPTLTSPMFGLDGSPRRDFAARGAPQARLSFGDGQDGEQGEQSGGAPRPPSPETLVDNIDDFFDNALYGDRKATVD